MGQFTQLNLQGKPEGQPPRSTSAAGQRPNVSHKGFTGKQKTAALLGSLLATSLVGILFLETSGCSKGNDRAAVIAPPAPVSTSPVMPSQASSTPPVTAVPAPMPEKKPVQKKRSRTAYISRYSDPASGLTFRYPRHYNLKKGDDASLAWAGLGPVQMNFTQPGGTTITAVEVPQRLYRGTDFTSAFFNVSVNPKLTAEECQKFAFPEAPQTATAGSQDKTAAAPVEPTKVKLGAANFTEVEDSAGSGAKQADAKYYHVFENGACYEFALGLETTADSSQTATKPVDREQVFRRLNWMLSTVKIKAPVPVKVASEKVASEKVATETAAPDKAETEKTVPDKTASEKAAPEKPVSTAAAGDPVSVPAPAAPGKQ
jgi:hypothetical protein